MKDGFRLRRDTSYHWKELDGKTTLYCTKSGNTIRKWAGKIYEKTHYERILLSSNSEDTINILKIKRGKSNLNQPFQTIEMEYFNGKNIDIQKRRIYLKYCKFGTPIYKKAEAQTFDGQEVVEVWRHRYISEKKITRDTVIDSEGTAHRIDLFPADLRSAGAWFPRRFKKSLRRNEDAFTYLNKKFLKEFDLNSKSKEKRTYVKSNQYEAKIIEIFYD